jgi:DNA-binding NarL/FixJ family response regulator
MAIEHSKILLGMADDHKIFRDGLRAALRDKDFLQVVWEVEDGKDLMHKLAVKIPDVLLMDVRIPNTDGIQAIARIRKEYPDIRIVVLTMYDEPQLVNRMMEMGANAFLTKMADPEEICQAILTCVREDFYFNDLVNQAVLLKLQRKRKVSRPSVNAVRFTEKELRILQLIADDKTTEEIAEMVFLSPRTVETIRQQMKQKAGVKTIAGLVMYATRHKILE